MKKKVKELVTRLEETESSINLIYIMIIEAIIMFFALHFLIRL
jgi:hypothetical protein